MSETSFLTLTASENSGCFCLIAYDRRCMVLQGKRCIHESFKKVEVHINLKSCGLPWPVHAHTHLCICVFISNIVSRQNCALRTEPLVLICVIYCSGLICKYLHLFGKHQQLGVPGRQFQFVKTTFPPQMKKTCSISKGGQGREPNKPSEVPLFSLEVQHFSSALYFDKSYHFSISDFGVIIGSIIR